MILVRWRANPKTVRVAVRRFEGRWLASVSPQNDTCRLCYTALSDTAEHAIDSALERAERDQLDGIDLGLGWAYEHPFRVK